MEQDDLKNLSQNEKNEQAENINENTSELNSKEKELTDKSETEKIETELEEEKKESAADIILKKLKDKKAKEETQEKEKKEDNIENLSNDEEKPEISQKEPEELPVDKSENIEKTAEEENKNIEAETQVKVDYSSYSPEELVEEFSRLLENDDVQKIKDRVELIKVRFYKKHNAEIAEAKEKFVKEGGSPEEFKPEPDKLEEKFKAFYSVFKERRANYVKQIEQQKQINLEKKYEIIEKIKQLTNGQESLNKTFHDFKELQKQWQEIGLVPQSELKKLWDSYHHWVEKFYDYVKINKELRDLDLKKNLEEKLKLCEKAEELLMEPKVVSAFRTLQKLHSMWREIGPVPAEKRDELWERFKKATTSINKKHQEYFEKLKSEQQNNLKAKTLLCEKVEEINETEITSPKEWEEQSKEVIELQRLWKLIGFAPKKDNNKIYTRFRKACDQFFNTKREFYSKHKEEEENNLQLKTELCIQAESMQDSTEWRKTTELYIELQKKWKTIGPVPRKDKDAIWERFRTACNKFFDNKAEYYKSLDSKQDENLELKKAIIEKLKNFEFSEDNSKNFEQLNKLQKEWTEIGYVPIKFKDEIQNEYKLALDKVFEKLDLDESEKMKLKFRSKLENLKNSPKSRGRLRSEREKIVKKLEKLKSDIVLWENNIGFFAKSKNAESMIKEFEEKINSAKTRAKILQEELYMIDDLLD
ncbi:MAG: DUF349 domain-containing protein [Bacteroidales bacterium]|nr:DUF349 domain-containing protein [Bacteroidales bacterium]